MTTYTAKTADLTAAAESIYTNIHTAEGAAEAAKIRKLAAKMEVSFEDALQAVLVKKIKFGAIKLGRSWYPVVNAEVQRNGYTFSSGALSNTVHIAGQHGVTLKV